MRGFDQGHDTSFGKEDILSQNQPLQFKIDRTRRSKIPCQNIRHGGKGQIEIYEGWEFGSGGKGCEIELGIGREVNCGEVGKGMWG